MYDGRGSAYSSLLGAVRTIARKEGVRGFCSGMLPASIAATVSWGGYFYFYEGCKTRWLNSVRARDGPTAELSHTQVLLSGIEAGSMMVLITNPLWLIKTRLQLQGSAAPIVVAVPGTAVSTGSVVAATSATTAQRHYSGLVDAVSCIVREEGVRGLYRGLLPALFLTSHGAVQFVTYEFLKKKVHMMGWSTRRGGSSSSSNSGSGSGSRTPGGGGGKDHLDIPVYLTAALGFMSKLVAATTTYPYQVVKSRLQQREVLVAAETGTGTSSVLRAQAKYRGTLDCMRQIVRYVRVGPVS